MTENKSSKNKAKVEKVTIGKSDLKMVRGSSSKTRTVYTVALSSQAVADVAIPAFESYGLKVLNKKPVETANGLEYRLEALEQSIIRTAIRLIKGSGIAVYRGNTPTYVQKASDVGSKLADKLAKKAMAHAALLNELNGAVEDSKEQTEKAAPKAESKGKESKPKAKAKK